MTDQPEQPNQFPADDFTSDLIGASGYNFDQPQKREFLPWHRPRKQFVREKQWAQQISLLIAETTPESGIIKYLGLPGDDLLDLRHFHNTICTPKGIKLKFLGFNRGINQGSDHKASLEVSLDEIRKLPNVDFTSDIIGDDLTNIALPRSIAWKRSFNMGPFDVINIDLCDGFAKQAVNDFKETHYNTLNQLVTWQARRKDPWLLFLTTKSDTEGVNDGVFETLKQIYIKNLSDCESFLGSSGECFSVTDTSSLESYCSGPAGFSNIFLTSLSKWILTLGLGQNPPSKVEVKSVMGYKVSSNASFPDLISIAIKITPTFHSTPDPVGLANQDIETIDECVLANRILKAVHKQRDVDDILANNDELMNEMIKATIDLLEQARYDITTYRAWLNGG